MSYIFTKSQICICINNKNFKKKKKRERLGSAWLTEKPSAQKKLLPHFYNRPIWLAALKVERAMKSETRPWRNFRFFLLFVGNVHLPEVKRHRCIVIFDSTARYPRHKGVIGWKKRPLSFVFRTNSAFQFEISLRCSPFDPINASSKQIFLLKCLEFNSSR